MAKRRRAKPKRRYTRRRASRWIRRRKPKIPMEIAITGAAIPFTPTKSGWWSPFQHLQEGNYETTMRLLAEGFTGFPTYSSDKFDIMRTLNPFDLEYARYTKMLIWAGIASKIRKKFVRIPFDKVPIIGRYIS